MPLESSESSKSSESDGFELKRLVQSHHLRRHLMDKNPSKWVRSERDQENDDEDEDDDVASSSGSSRMNIPNMRSDWTRRSRQNSPSERRGGKMSRSNTDEDEYDEDTGRDPLPSTRGPYHAFQLAADRLTGDFQVEIAQQLESVEEQLEAVGLQMQEAIAAGFKDGTFKSRIWSSDVEVTEPQSFSADIPVSPVCSRKGSASIPKLRDSGLQTSPTCVQYSTHASTHPFLCNDDEYITDARQPFKRQPQAGDNEEPPCQSECHLVTSKYEDKHENDVAASSSNAQHSVPHNCGFEYNILKLEGMDPDSKGFTSTETIVFGDSKSSDYTQKTQGESKLYQARGCQTCRCHSCRKPSDSVPTVQILGVVGCSQGESSTSRSREFVTMDIKKGRIPQSLGLIEICRDFEAQEGEYEHIWKQASEWSSTEVMDSPVEDKASRLHVTNSRKPSELGGRSVRVPFQEADGSSLQKSEEPETKIRRSGVQMSKFLLEGPTSSKGRGVQQLGNLYDEAETSVEQSSSLISCPYLLQEEDQNSKENCEESEARTWQSFALKSKPPPERSISLEGRGVHELGNLYDVVEYPARKSRSRNSGAEILHKVSCLEKFEEPETRHRQDHALNIKSKLVPERRDSSESRGVQKLGRLQDEAQHATGEYSSVILEADLLQEAGQSSKESSEEPKVKKWEGSALKSKSLRERTITLKGQDDQELTHLLDETEYALGHSSAGRTSNLKKNSEGPEKRKFRSAVQNWKPSGERQARVEGRGVQELGSLHNETELSVGQSSSAVNRLERDKEPSDYTNALRPSHGNDSTRNIRSEIFSKVDEEFVYSASRSTDDSLEVEELVGRKERNFTKELETHSVRQMQRHSSSPLQDTEARSCKNRDIEAVNFQGDHVLSGPRQSQSDEKRRSKSNLNPYYNPNHCCTSSWSQQKLKQKSDRVDRTSRDRDTLRSSLTFSEEGTVSLRPEEETSRNVVASRKVETTKKSKPLVTPRSNYESTPSVGGVSCQRLATRASRRSALDDLLDKPRPDSRPSSSEKRTEIGTEEAPKGRVPQSRVYIGVRHDYESGDHVSHQEMQGRMLDEIAKEFSLLGIHSQIPNSRKSISKSKSGVRGPSDHSHENINVRRPETFQLEEGSPTLHNLYREDIDLRSKAPRMCSLNGIPTQVDYDIPIEYSSTGQICAVEKGALDQSLQDGRVCLEHQDPRGEPRASTTQRLADVGRSKRRSKTAQRSRFEQDEFVEPQVADSKNDVTHRRPTPYPLSSRASARLPKEKVIRQLQSPQKLDEFSSKLTVECTQEPGKPHWAGDGGFSVTKASSSDDYQAPNLGKKGDAILQILNRKSGSRRKNRETSIQHTVSNIPRGCSLERKPELTPLSSLQDSTLHMDSTNANVIHGPQYTESIESSIPIISRPSTLLPRPPSFRDSETREFREQEPTTRHPTMIDEDWKDPSVSGDLVEDEDRNCQKLEEQNLKTVSSKSSQKYLAKMLTRLSQKLGVLESKGLIESNVQTQTSQHFDPQRILPSETTESGDQYWAPGPLTRRQGNVESELRQQFDRLRSRKSQDFPNSMQRRRSQWPSQEDLSIETKDNLSSSFVDEDDQKTSDTSTKWSHRSGRSSMLTNNLELLAMDIASKRNEISQKQELLELEEWHPGTPHSLSWQNQYEEVENESKHHPQLLGRSENHTRRIEAVSDSAAEQDYPTQMPPEGSDYWRPRLPETWEFGGEDRSSGPSTRRQGDIVLELRRQFDHPHLRKNEDSTHLMRRSRSQWPFAKDSSILTIKYTLSQGLMNDEFSEDHKPSHTSTKLSHHNSRSSTLANNLELLRMEMTSKEKEISQEQELQKEWQPRTSHSLSWRDQSQEVEAKSEHSSQDRPENHVMRADADSRSRAHRDVQTQMPPSFKDKTLVRSSHHPSERTENRDSPNRISTQTQTLDETNAQDEMQSKDGYEVLSRPSIHHNTFTTTGTFRGHHRPPNSEESPLDRSLERWNPRPSKGGQQRQQVDSMMKTKEQSQAQTRNGTSTQTDEFGPFEPLTFEPQFRQDSRPKRMDSMETQPRDLDYRGNEYLEHQLPQLLDSFYLRGQQDSRFHQITEAGSHQHSMSQSQRMSGIPLQPEEDVVKNLQLSQSQPPQSDLEDMVSRNSHRSHNQKMEGTGVRHETVRGMGGMNVMNLRQHSHVPMPQEFQTERMHSFAGQLDSNKPYHLADTVANSRQHFQVDSVHSFGVLETVVSGFPHHSQTGGIYSHVVQPNHGFPYHSHTGRKYDQAMEPEGIILEMHHPSQSGRMYRGIVQPEVMEIGNRSNPHTIGKYGFAEHDEIDESRSTRPSQRGKMSNLLVKPEGEDPGFSHHTRSGIYNSPSHPIHHQSIGGRMYEHARQSEVDYLNRHPSHRGTMPNFPDHAVDLDPGNHHYSQNDRKNSSAGIPKNMDLEPERMHSFAVQPEGLDASLHPSDLEGVHTFAVHPDDTDFRSSPPSTFKIINNIVTLVEPEVQNPRHGHPSQKEQMYSSQVQGGLAEPGSRHLSMIDRMHSFALQPEIPDSGIRKTSQKQIPEIRASHHSVIRRPENRSKDLEDLPSERGAGEEKTSTVRHPLNDLPPEFLNLGSKNPKKSSQIQMLNDILQDLEVTISKSRQNSQARMKSHMLEHKFDLVAGSKGQELPKKIKFQTPEDEQSNLGGKVEENFDNFDRENLESPGENRETFHGVGGQLDSESVQPFENQLPESQREFESEKSEFHTFEEGNFDHLENEQSGTLKDKSDYLPGDHSVAGQQDEQSDLEGSLHAVQGSNHKDRHHSSSSRRSISSHSSGGSRLYNQRGSQRQGSRRRLQSQMKTVPRASSCRSNKNDVSRTSRSNSEHRSRSQTKHMPKQSAHCQTEPQFLQTSGIMPETAETSETGEVLESEGEELVPYETQREELTSLETQGKDFAPLGTDCRLYNQRGPQRQGSRRRLQSQMKTVPRASSCRSNKNDVSRTSRSNSERRSRSQTKHMPKQSAHCQTEPQFLQTSGIMPDAETSEIGEELVSLESEGEELVPYETQREELTSLETQGEDFAPLGTGDVIDSRELPVKKFETDKRRVTSRVVDGKDRSLKAKAKKLEAVEKDFASGGSYSLSARYQW